MPDTKIFDQDLRWMIDTTEKIVTDKGYRGLINVLTPLNAKDEKHKKIDGTCKGKAWDGQS